MARCSLLPVNDRLAETESDSSVRAFIPSYSRLSLVLPLQNRQQARPLVGPEQLEFGSKRLAKRGDDRVAQEFFVLRNQHPVGARVSVGKALVGMNQVCLIAV